MIFKTFPAICLLALVSWFFGASPVVSSEHTRNLKLLETAPMLFEYHNQTISDRPAYFTYPRRDTTFRKNFVKTEKYALMNYYSDRIAIAASLVGGIDYRGGETLNDTIWPSIDGGIYLRGYADSIDFVLDALMFDEAHTADYPKSFDGEVIEFQKDENNSGVEYTRYARYRTHFAFNYDWLRLDFGRDVMHWGPG